MYKLAMYFVESVSARASNAFSTLFQFGATYIMYAYIASKPAMCQLLNYVRTYVIHAPTIIRT